MTNSSFSVAVLVSAGRHPASGAPRVCRGDAVAMAVARQLAGDAARVVHAGDPQEPSLKDYLALGAGTIEALTVDATANPVTALVPYLKTMDIILTGMRAEIGQGSGMVPYALAQALGRPVVPNILEARVVPSATAGWEVRVRQFLPKGKRRNVATSLPVILAVHPLAPAQLNYAHARRMSGRIDIRQGEISVLDTAISHWTVTAAGQRSIRLKAQDKKAGHARMLSAIVSEAKGGVVAFEGTSVDKAQVMLNYLREHRLIDF